MKKSKQITAVLSFIVLGSNSAFSAEFDYELRAGGTYSDNAKRSSLTKEGDLIVFAGFALDAGHESRRINAGLLADIDFNHYTDGSFDDEVFGALNADLEIDLVPSLLTWLATNRFGKLLTDTFQEDVAQNRGVLNSFSTGPNLEFQIGNRTKLGVGGRYTDNYFEQRDSGNNVLSGDLSLGRAISPNRTIGIAATYEDISFENEQLNTDYDRSSVFLTFESEISKGSVSASVGINEIDVDGKTTDGTLAQLSFLRELTNRTSLVLNYDQRFSNSGDIFQSVQTTSDRDFGNTQDIPGDGEPFESRRLSMSLDYNFGSNSFFVRAASEQQDYESANIFERRRNSFGLGLSRRLASDWQFSTTGQFTRLDYRNIERDDDDISADLRLSKQLTRLLYLDFGYRYFDRSSTSALGDSTENRYTISLRYDPE